MTYEERMKWFNQARFGIFVHWGLYAIPARGEWVMFSERISVDEYAKLADQFNPTRFDADEWAAIAKNAGAKYMVLTTRHHDGFCLWDSKVSDFTSVKTASKRDSVREFCDACRRAGLKVGLYYSWRDWRFAGYWDAKADPRSARAMVDQAREQVNELMSNYGKIDILWYDGLWIHSLGRDLGSPEQAAFWGTPEINANARRLQPHIIINNRCGTNEDIDTPEQKVEASEPGRAWESCMTMGESWGYVAHDPNIRSASQILNSLVTAASGEGNYLLNIGPKADGSIARRELSRLDAIGNWMSKYGESIYGSERCPFHPGRLGMMTAKGNTVYYHIIRYPKQDRFSLWGIKNTIKSATIMATGQKLFIEPGADGRLWFRGLPKTPPDKMDTVIKMEVDGKPDAIPVMDLWPSGLI
jgi:alpha-L-fucosidase